jgi:hypothetical protein
MFLWHDRQEGDKRTLQALQIFCSKCPSLTEGLHYKLGTVNTSDLCGIFLHVFVEKDEERAY